MPPGQANKRRSTTSVSEATPIEVPAHMSTAPSPVNVSADLSPVDASPSLQTADIGSSVKRVRGPMRGKNTSRLITQHGGKKLFVGVSIERRTFWGLNATKAANELGAQIRLQATLQGTENWKDVPLAIRAAIVQFLWDKFEIEGYDESPLPQEIIDTKSTHLFKGWRYHMNQHYKELVKEGTDPYSKPFVREKMDQLCEKASQLGATSLTQEQITVQVLGKRSGYLKGFGVGPKPSSAFNSRARSQVHDEEVKGLKEEVALLKGIIQSYEGCFDQFEHFMRQMQGNHSGYDSFDE
ncbi:hypothetical protein LOK49_LG03G02763 [Camellia lanceoleosa]|uniref:Uncharacterized protein n=1 Tax=Camellia lanceoleosa TaxID=1840588 RepID=A0ACC0IFK7_9ERIC|nr:hypothetical protein LOK49_LG03G02763 [Camellia lanceoleosa]